MASSKWGFRILTFSKTYNLLWYYPSICCCKLLERKHHRHSMYQYAEAYIKWAKNTKLICSSMYEISFFLNCLFSWEFGKVFFSQNWKEEWNKKTHCSKKILLFKTQTHNRERRSVNVKLGFLCIWKKAAEVNPVVDFN